MVRFIAYLRKSWVNLDRVARYLLAAMLIVMLSLPVIRIIFGDQVMVQGMSLAVLLQVAIILNLLHNTLGWWSVLRTAISVVLFVWVVQAIILRSGLPYGSLNYTTLLQPQVLGVPLLIPLTWLMMLPPAWASAKIITRRAGGCVVRPIFILVSSLVFTSWTIYFDPLLVRLGLVQWTPPGSFYGTPWQNYIFWLFIAGLTTLAISPKRLPAGALVLVYAFTWITYFALLMVIGELVFPAVLGFTLMGGFLVSAALINQ
jgi:uncharacterized membrane protein